MKSGILTLIGALTFIALLTMPMRLAAQESQVKHQHYKVVDFGTGLLNAERGTNGAPSLNQGGTMVGAFTTPALTTAASNPLVCSGFPFVLHSFKGHDGAFAELGALAGSGSCSIPFQVNASGDVVGVSESGEVDPLTGFNQSHAVLWRGGKIIDLGSFGGNQNAALASNNSGQIAGNSLNTIPDPYSIVDLLLGTFNGTQTRGFIWQHGELQDIGTLGGNDTSAGLINERGQIAGFSYTNTTANPTTGLPTVDPFLWENGKMLDLGTLGGVSGAPTWLNNHGQVVGQSNLAGDTDSHPFLWTKGRLIDLATSTTGGQPIFAAAIDDAGNIIGAADFPNAPFDAYVWKDGVARDLGHVNGDCMSEADGINSRGQIVGISYPCDGSRSNAYLWEQGELVDLNSLVPPNSPHLTAAVDINDRGEIAAGSDDGSVILLVPITQREEEVISAPVDNSATTSTQRTPTSDEVAAVRARWWHLHRGFKAWPRH